MAGVGAFLGETPAFAGTGGNGTAAAMRVMIAGLLIHVTARSPGHRS
jgi:hypothetical protein